MLQIKNVLFNKGDFLYTIEYFDGRCVRKIATNEEALNSFPLSVGALAETIRDHLLINESYNCKINSIRFGKNEDSPNTVQMSFTSGMREMNILTKIKAINSNQNVPEVEQVALYNNLIEVRGECERYINGERAQKELNFEGDINA